MKHCILCNKETSGSVGAAGIKWLIICQPCKDKEDQALIDRIEIDSRSIDIILDKIGASNGT